MEKKKFQMPHTYIIIFGVILVAALLTCFIPLGKYDTKEITYTVNGSEKTRTVVDPDSFQYILDENGNKVTQAAPIFGTEDFGGRGGIVNYVFEGMTAGSRGGGAVAIIAFTLVVGGAFGIVLRTGAVEGGIMRVISLTNGKEIILIPILITLFSLGGAVFGMGEEAIPFVMILVPMFIAMGYDAVVGIMCSYVATQIGFGLDVGPAGIGRQIRRKAVIADEVVFVDLVVIVPFGIVVDVLDIPMIVQYIRDVATGQTALGTAAAFFLVKAIVGVSLQVARLGIPERGCHSRRSHGQGGQGRCHNKFFHNLPPPYNTGYLLP